LHSAIGASKESDLALVRYVISAKSSKFTLRAFATGLLSAFAHSPVVSIPDFEGDVLVHTGGIENSSVRVLIRAASLVVVSDVPDKDRAEINRRMQQEVLESDRFPDIEYECGQISAKQTSEGQYGAVLDGKLSLHGVTRTQPLSAHVTVSEDSLRAAGEFSVRLSDYEISPVTAVGGAIKLKDELRVSFDVKAQRQG
jgi:polyisoprenoid-binding protein YceI